MARRRGRACFGGEESAVPAQSSGEEEMTMHRYTNTIPVVPACGGTQRQLQMLCQTLTNQNAALLEILSAVRELLEVIKEREDDPGG